MRQWILPEYVEDILPAEARRIEMMRRRIMDLLWVHGYELVGPPLLEYVESLLSGSGGDTNLRMFKVVDQLSGRMMGLRADMTPQVARIDAHLLNRKGITRLCYAGSVLHTLPSGLTRTREPLQIGAELYGHSGLESDLEVQRLLLESLAIAGLPEIHLDLGHVAVFRGLVRGSGIPAELETELFEVLQAKDTDALKSLCAGLTKHVDTCAREALLLLPELYGDVEVLERARRFLPDYPEIRTALDELETVGEELNPLVDTLAFDLADLRGYHYHSGMVFAAYAGNSPNAIALGGRYDEVGKAFGRARPATGFSMDLRELSGLVQPGPSPRGILAPYIKGEKALEQKIVQLRNEGEIVVVELPGHERDQDMFNCDRKLVLEGGVWLTAGIEVDLNVGLEQ
ncbi:ATP phosphoribosyltransferase regulatory subunit [Nitrosovibrio tenuis]|uniref:ATP phosphoribosyltransferase regulatory subunit n=1 Tax=Nitrosovibrio tenuis TaxID=1233 RepID=A0A1H7PFS9_9PROT|nr:ATP phosphoribosyltransferase regulatory subunit [Nitrosovibrio tenuis]SEL34640.1 ATP phosphoribosyltransferase regulatory subunit [Nitrosovibrio tenuis]